MDRVYQANAIETPPSSTPSSGSYPTAGNKASGQLATVPGPYWFYSITEEIRNAIIAAGLTPNPAQVNQLAAAMAKFLPLNGGTLTGAIKTNVGDLIVKTNDDGYLCITGATKSTNGARLVLSGKDRQGLEGRFTLVARDANGEKSLTGTPSGSLTWNGKEIITSAGGTLTGDLKFAGGNIKLAGDASGITIFGGTGTNGAYLQAFGQNADGNNGRFNLVASNGSAATSLMGQPEGVLSWGGKWVETVESSGGNHVRYHSGLQICWASVSGVTNIWNFPVAFSSAPIVLGSPSGSGAHPGVRVDAVSTTAAWVSNGNSWNTNAIAIGRWK